MVMSAGSARRSWAIALLGGLIAGCGAELPSEPTGRTAPTITRVTPQTPVAGPAAQTLEIRGERFSTGLSLTVLTPGDGTRTIPASSLDDLTTQSFTAAVVLDAPGTYTLAVRNVGGEVSPPFVLTVIGTADQSRPVVSGIVPSILTQSPAAQVVIVQGANFAAGLSVSVTDPDGLVSTQTASAVANLTPTRFELAMVFNKVGTYALQVVNPSGETSGVANVVVGQ